MDFKKLPYLILLFSLAACNEHEYRAGFGISGDENKPASPETKISQHAEVNGNVDVEDTPDGGNGTIDGSNGTAVPTKGRLYVWGVNVNGELGLGQRSEVKSPALHSNHTNWQRAATGNGVSLAIRDGKLYAWGRNHSGMLGNGTNVSSLEPVQVGNASGWSDVAASNTSYGIRDGKLFAWGSNAYGQVGDGTITDRLTPTQIGTKTCWTSVSAGLEHALGLCDGKLYAWGRNEHGQLGTGSWANSNVPVQVTADSGWDLISAGSHFSTAIRNGKLYIWGRYQWHLVTTMPVDLNVPTRIDNFSDWTDVSAGFHHALAIRDGKLYAGGGWSTGHGELASLGPRAPMFSEVTTPITGWTKVFARNTFSSGIAGGKLYSWGWNEYSQLGIGTTTDTAVPTNVTACQGQGEAWVTISQGNTANHVLAICSK